MSESTAITVAVKAPAKRSYQVRVKLSTPAKSAWYDVKAIAGPMLRENERRAWTVEERDADAEMPYRLSVGPDGSPSCNCDGHRSHGHCKHADWATAFGLARVLEDTVREGDVLVAISERDAAQGEAKQSRHERDEARAECARCRKAIDDLTEELTRLRAEAVAASPYVQAIDLEPGDPVMHVTRKGERRAVVRPSPGQAAGRIAIEYEDGSKRTVNRDKLIPF